MSILTLPTQYIRQKYVALYASDTWRITPKLTLNHGLRWDFSTPSHDKYNNASYIDHNKPNPGANKLPGSLVFAGNKAGDASLRRPYPEDIFYKGFSPRIGFAYSMTPKPVVRAGYG